MIELTRVPAIFILMCGPKGHERLFIEHRSFRLSKCTVHGVRIEYLYKSLLNDLDKPRKRYYIPLITSTHEAPVHSFGLP